MRSLLGTLEHYLESDIILGRRKNIRRHADRPGRWAVGGVRITRPVVPPAFLSCDVQLGRGRDVPNHGDSDPD